MALTDLSVSGDFAFLIGVMNSCFQIEGYVPFSSIELMIFVRGLEISSAKMSIHLIGMSNGTVDAFLFIFLITS